MSKRRVALLLLSLPVFLSTQKANGQVLSYSPQQKITKKVQVWAVTGCTPKPIPAAQIQSLAGQHGLTWLTPSSASTLLAQRSIWAQISRYAGFAVAGASALTSWKVVQASSAWTEGLTGGAGFLNVLLPLAQKQVPVIDPSIGGNLLPDIGGCGTAMFYAVPSTSGPFSAEVK